MSANTVTAKVAQLGDTIPFVEPTEDGTRDDGEAAAAARAPGAARRRLGGVAAFDYLNSSLELAGTYRAVMGVLRENSRSFAISMPTSAVLARLAASGTPHDARSPEHLDQVLEKLESWGCVSRTQDVSLAKSIEDLKRKRSLWRITEQGRIAEDAAAAIEASFGASGALRSVVLADIERQVGVLAQLAHRGELSAEDGRTAFTTLGIVFAQTKQLADNAVAFIEQLDEFLSAPEMTTDAFVIARDVIVGYVGGFLRELRATAPAIAAVIAAMPDDGVERLVAAAAAADTPVSTDAMVDTLAAETDALRAQWRGVEGWFVGTPEGRPLSRDLADRAADAITTLLRILARMNDARHRTISRSRDFAALAHWFEQADSDTAAHRLWHAVFGLEGARHLRYPVPDDEFTPPSASWWTHPPVAIEPRFRALGQYDARGRSAPIADKREAQARIRVRAAEAASRRARALDRFLDADPAPLSDLPPLADEEFDVLTECLMTALGARPEPDGTWLVPSLDGRYLISLAPPPDDSPIAAVACPRGTFRGRDWTFTLVSAGTVRRPRAEEAAS